MSSSKRRGRPALVGLVSASLLLVTANLNSREALRLRVTPPVSVAPGYLTVRVTIESAADNRRLQIVAESPDFYRSSEVDLDGANAAPTSVFEFRNLPTGMYEVTGVLVGVRGVRGTAIGVAKVEPSPGQR